MQPGSGCVSTQGIPMSKARRLNSHTVQGFSTLAACYKTLGSQGPWPGWNNRALWGWIPTPTFSKAPQVDPLCSQGWKSPTTSLIPRGCYSSVRFPVQQFGRHWELWKLLGWSQGTFAYCSSLGPAVKKPAEWPLIWLFLMTWLWNF